MRGKTRVTSKCSRITFAGLVPGMLALSIIVAPPVTAQKALLDPAATQTLQQMTDYLDSLKQFSVHTQITLEDLLATGQRIDTDISTNVIISRPNRLHAERKGELLDQAFYYDGKTLTLYNSTDGVYANEPAPATIEGMLDYARESLGLIIPVSDLAYRNAYPLLMQGVTSAMVIGKAVINGVTCDHLAFSRPDVDFQIWIADAERPLPCKYVVTDTSTPALISISTVMSDWNVAPQVSDKRFTFVPPDGAQAISFMPLDTGGTAATGTGAGR